MTAVDEHRQLDALGPAIVEERLDPCADRPAGVEHVIDEHDGLAFEQEVERRRADDRLGMARRTTSADLDVVAIEGDVDGAEVRSRAGPLLDQPSQTMRERDAARLDADERDSRQIGIRLDDLVRDSRQRPAQSVGIEENPPRRSLHGTHRVGSVGGLRAGSFMRLLPGLTGPA